ncbi:MAG: nucleotidyl transferase AbiEii/AbiGii toxin family protein [Candidatus Omnitrophota bacterium]|nr:nucleotidyl transferase AbiEii/AbiGii toxin family protein [Candidatus Omnitrophota bacterium]
MANLVYTHLQLREIFHLEFLRWFGRKNKAIYAVKGGANLRFFFNSIRYSEDMDLDIKGVEVAALKNKVLEILTSGSFQDNMRPFGIENIIAPDIGRAKQTETTQRFKVHLIAYSGEDLFTKIEFSRRGLKQGITTESVSDSVLRQYKLAPLLAGHYDIGAAITQKIEALAGRAVLQARDVFDLYTLSSQYEKTGQRPYKTANAKLKTAYENIFAISFEQFRDTVITYLSAEDQDLYDSPKLWDDIQLKAADFINGLKGQDA